MRSWSTSFWGTKIESPPSWSWYGHVVGRELLRDGRGVGGLEVGEERRVARLGDHAHEEVAADHHDGDGDEGDGLLAGREPVGEAAGAGPPAVDVGCGDERHQKLMSMMELNASSALVVSAWVTCVSTEAWVAAIMASPMFPWPAATCAA